MVADIKQFGAGYLSMGYFHFNSSPSVSQTVSQADCLTTYICVSCMQYTNNHSAPVNSII